MKGYVVTNIAETESEVHTFIASFISCYSKEVEAKSRQELLDIMHLDILFIF